MSAEAVINIVSKECKNKCDFTVRKSATSNSLYFTLANDISKVIFRISDHIPSKSIHSYQLKGKKDAEKITKFVRKSIERLKIKSVYWAIEKINGQKIFA